jgi:WD40 repeat protein
MVGHTSMITAMTFSPDSRLIATGSFDGEVRLWISPTGEMGNLGGSKRENGNVVSVLFSSNGQLLAAGWVQPGQIQIWNTSIQSGQDPVRQVTCSSELMAFAFSHDDELLVSAQGDHVEVHRISDGVTLCSIGHYYADPDQIALSPDGTLIAMLCSRSKVIHLWDIQEEPQPLAVVMYGGIWSNSRLSIHGDGYLVYGSYVWLLESVQSRPQLISGKRLPSTLRKDTRSLIAYRNGWVHSAVAGGRLIAIPKYMGVDEVSRWSACGNLIAFATGTGKPLIVDCTPMLQM